MFDINGREPILSKAEIRFLLSDSLVGEESKLRQTRNRATGKTKAAQRKPPAGNPSPTIGEYRQP